MSQRDPAVAFRHMLDIATPASGFVHGRERAALDTDAELRYAPTYVVLGIGEAANRLSPEVQAEYPGVPWTGLIGMRHRLVHGYDTVDRDRLWRVCTEDLPLLIEQLHAILEELGTNEG
jgi:uncharacterized protein with HEPN domain